MTSRAARGEGALAREQRRREITRAIAIAIAIAIAHARAIERAPPPHRRHHTTAAAALRVGESALRDTVPSHRTRCAVRARARAHERRRLRDFIDRDRNSTRARSRELRGDAAAVAAAAVHVGGVDVTQRRDVTSRAARGEGARALARERQCHGTIPPGRLIARARDRASAAAAAAAATAEDAARVGGVGVT